MKLLDDVRAWWDAPTEINAILLAVFWGCAVGLIYAIIIVSERTR